jgi:DNA-binding GntR family transcriptional regulator
LPGDPEVLALAETSLYEIVERVCGTIATRAHYVVEARAAYHREAELLNIAIGSPILLTTQVTFDQHHEPFELHWSVYPHDRYRFQATLTRPANHRRVAAAGRRPETKKRGTRSV